MFLGDRFFFIGKDDDQLPAPLQQFYDDRPVVLEMLERVRADDEVTLVYSRDVATDKIRDSTVLLFGP